MAVQGIPLAGTGGRVQIVGLNLAMAMWECDPSGGDIKTTNFESQACEEGIIGISLVDIRVQGFYDALKPPYQLLGLKPSVIVTGLKLIISKNLNNFFSFPSFRLLRAPTTVDVDNKAAMFSFTAKSDGPWFYPLA